MLDQLLESRPRSNRSVSQISISVAAHTTVIAVAVFATAHAHTARVEERPTRIIWPRAYVAPPSRPVKSSGTTVRHGIPSIWIDPAIVVPAASLPTLPGVSVDGSMFQHAPSLASALQSTDAAPASLSEPFRSDQVEVPATSAPGNVPPVYPEQLRINGIEGQVVAAFVIDTTGRAEPTSIRFAKQSNALFEASVRSALARMRFIPARYGGTRVRQLVEMPFVFTINR